MYMKKRERAALNLSMLGQKSSESGRLTVSIGRMVSFVIVLVVCLGSGLTFSQNPPASAPKAADIVTYLTETISWYRGTVVEQQIANRTERPHVSE